MAPTRPSMDELAEASMAVRTPYPKFEIQMAGGRYGTTKLG